MKHNCFNRSTFLVNVFFGERLKTTFESEQRMWYGSKVGHVFLGKSVCGPCCRHQVLLESGTVANTNHFY